jgi:transposase-like protein
LTNNERSLYYLFMLSTEKHEATATCTHPKTKKFGYTRTKVQRYSCESCGKTFSDPKPKSSLGVMRISMDAAVRVLQCLLEGCSIRSTERLCNVNRNTIMSLLLLAGDRCQKLMDSRMQNLNCRVLQCDEIWTFVAKKQKHVRMSDPAEFGDAWIFIALDAESKLVPSFAIGKRNFSNTIISHYPMSAITCDLPPSHLYLLVSQATGGGAYMPPSTRI